MPDMTPLFVAKNVSVRSPGPPRAISFQNEVRRKFLAEKEYSTDRCLFKGEKRLIELFSSITLVLDYMGKCDGVIQRTYMKNLSALARSLQGKCFEHYAQRFRLKA